MDLKNVRLLFGGSIVLPRPLGFLYSALGVVGATLLLFALRGFLGKDAVALFYVLVIIVCAGLAGPRGWWFAPVLAFLTMNFFFTVPAFTFHVADPQDWLLLAAFLVVGLVSGRLIGQLHERTREALARQHDLQILNRLSGELVSGASTEAITEAMTAALGEAHGRTVLFVAEDGRLRAIGDGEPDETEAAVGAWVLREGKAVGLPQKLGGAAMRVPWPVSVDWPEGLPGPARGVYLPLQASSGRLEGVLFNDRTLQGADAIDRTTLLVSAANIAAAFMEHQDLQSKAWALSALEEADRLKSGFLSAVSHDLKTPLAAAQVRVTGLLEDDVACGAARLREDLRSAAESLERLDAILGDLLDLSRLEGDAWRPRLEPLELGEVISTMLSRLRQEERRRVSVRVAEGTPLVTADFRQLERAVRNLVENALAYTDGAVHVTVETGPGTVMVAVEDEGAGVPHGERESVFDRFHRGSTAEGSPSGSGLGLAIVREIVRAHGGRLSVEDAVPHGARFVIGLPSTPKAQE